MTERHGERWKSNETQISSARPHYTSKAAGNLILRGLIDNFQSMETLTEICNPCRNYTDSALWPVAGLARSNTPEFWIEHRLVLDPSSRACHRKRILNLRSQKSRRRNITFIV